MRASGVYSKNMMDPMTRLLCWSIPHPLVHPQRCRGKLTETSCFLAPYKKQAGGVSEFFHHSTTHELAIAYHARKGAYVLTMARKTRCFVGPGLCPQAGLVSGYN
jgi:hypothetical protein